MNVQPHKAANVSALIMNIAHAVTDISQGAFPALLPFIAIAFKLNYSQVGDLLLIQSLTSSLCQPLFGYISDRWSSSLYIPAGVLLSGIAMGAIIWAPDYTVLIMLISLSGIGSAMFHPQAMKASNRISPPNQKGARIGMFSLGGNFGFALGALIMAQLLLLPGGFDNTPWIALPSVIFIFVLLFFMRHIKMASHAGDKSAASRKSSEGASAEGGSAAFIAILIAFIAFRSTAYTAITSYTPLYHVKFMNELASFSGNYVAVFSMAGVAGTYLGGVLSDVFGRKRIIIISMLLTVPLTAVIPFVSGIWAMVLAGIIGFALVASYSSTLVMAQESMKNNMGLAAGLTVGFAIGLGGVGSKFLGHLADAITLPLLMKWFWLLPLGALLLTLLFPKDTPSNSEKA